jgi:hypothetical protein
MNISKITLLVGALCVFMLGSKPAEGAIYWVGESPACDALANARDTLSLAVLAAALTADNDEIRLTNMETYNGTFGDQTFTDFKPGVRGSLVVSGGYADCGSGQSGRALIENSSGDTLTVQTSVETLSVVTFRNIEIINSGGRAIYTSGGAEVTLDNLLIRDNRAGVSAWKGAFINMMANTVIRNNGTSGDYGGGIYCTGSNSLVLVQGRLTRNYAVGGNGGNIYLSNGCFVELAGGTLIEGDGETSAKAVNGGGIHVAAGGELFSDGGASLVSIINHSADNGAGLYVAGTGKAILRNTEIKGNHSNGGEGTAIYAIDGGLAGAQVVMDVVGACSVLFACSNIESNSIFNSLVFVSNSLVDIHRTVIQTSTAGSGDTSAMVKVTNNGEARLNSLNISGNDVDRILVTDGSAKIIVTHTTMVDNSGSFEGNTVDSFIGLAAGGIMDFQNSIMVDTQGVDNRGGSIVGKCNMVDVPKDMPGSAYFIDTPIFITPELADYRQTADSPGVDMCQDDYFAFSNSRDLGFQLRPVNDGTNPAGTPGEAGGNYDGGFWESYENVVYILNLSLAGPGALVSQVVSSNVPGIDCPGDCGQPYDQGLLVNLQATPAPGFSVSWSGCDSDAGNQCSVTMNSNKSISATFNGAPLDDLIFVDGFESEP